MERAAQACVEFIRRQWKSTTTVIIFCGRGNNGGDGLAIARLLHELDYPVKVNIMADPGQGSPDFQVNFKKLKALEDIQVDIYRSRRIPGNR